MDGPGFLINLPVVGSPLVGWRDDGRLVRRTRR
jgi:hypothetical protein